MANVIVATGVKDDLNRGVNLHTFVINETTGYTFLINSANDLIIRKTTDKGVTYSTVQTITGTIINFFAVWAQDTDGITDTLIHFVTADSVTDLIVWNALDTSDDTLVGAVTVSSPTAVDTSEKLNRVNIGVAGNGDIGVAFSTQTNIGFFVSANGGTSWTGKANVHEVATQEDYVLLFDANVDAGDFLAIFVDRSANLVTAKMFDASAGGGSGTWTESSVGSMVDEGGQLSMDGAIRFSDAHLMLTYHSDFDNTTDDLLCFDINPNSIASPGVTAKTNIFTNVDNSAECGLQVNQQNDDIRVSYLLGGTWLIIMGVKAKLSTDGMGVWGGEIDINIDADDDYRLVKVARSATDNGSYFLPNYYDDDDLLIINDTSTRVDFAAVGAVNMVILAMLQHNQLAGGIRANA